MRRSVAAALAAAVLLAACQAGTGSPTPSPTGTPTVTAAPTPTPTPTPVPTPTPTPTPAPTPTPFATGSVGAVAFVQGYEDALVGSHYRKAWNMLGAGWQAYLGTLATYTAERTAFMALAGTRYTAVANPPSTKSLSAWLNGADFSPSIDMGHAVLVQVTWTRMYNNIAGWEMWVVNPVPGGWELYEVR